MNRSNVRAAPLSCNPASKQADHSFATFLTAIIFQIFPTARISYFLRIRIECLKNILSRRSILFSFVLIRSNTLLVKINLSKHKANITCKNLTRTMICLTSIFYFEMNCKVITNDLVMSIEWVKIIFQNTNTILLYFSISLMLLTCRRNWKCIRASMIDERRNESRNIRMHICHLRYHLWNLRSGFTRLAWSSYMMSVTNRFLWIRWNKVGGISRCRF